MENLQGMPSDEYKTTILLQENNVRVVHMTWSSTKIRLCPLVWLPWGLHVCVYLCDRKIHNLRVSTEAYSFLISISSKAICVQSSVFLNSSGEQ